MKPLHRWLARRRHPHRNRALARVVQVEHLGTLVMAKPAIAHWHLNGHSKTSIAHRVRANPKSVWKAVHDAAEGLYGRELMADVAAADSRRAKRIYRAAATNPDLSVLLVAAWNPHCPADLIEALAHCPTLLVRYGIACRDDLTDDLWRTLANDPASVVRDAVRTNLSATEEARATAWMLGA